MTDKQIKKILREIGAVLRVKIDLLSEEAKLRVWKKIEKVIKTEQKRLKALKTASYNRRRATKPTSHE